MSFFSNTPTHLPEEPFLMLLSCSASAEPLWTWVSGSNMTVQPGVYSGNVPGVREGSVSWTDASGNFWLFGGWWYCGGCGNVGYLNDLWKFDGTNWTWVSGFNVTNKPGVYGTKGVAASDNVPGARDYSVSWTDASGNLWLFGGYGYAASGSVGYLNDLWKFNGTNWTWVSGSNTTNQPGVYGTKGVADQNNVPGARYVAVSWTDASGNLWLFGGINDSGGFNDLWKFDGVNWTWVSGSNAINQPGVYGTKGVAAPDNMPGAGGGVSWTDASDNLWLFGGGSNDLWKFDGANWTWVSGSGATSQYGVYGTKGVADQNNVPGARSGAVSWADAGGNFWLFGGSGYATSGHGYLNDLWKFDGANWTWVSGSSAINQVGVYGTKGVAAPGNMPGARYRSVSWIDASSNFWLFGGHNNNGSLNDLWKFDGVNWTWVSGSNAPAQYGSYGSYGAKGETGNMPGTRDWSVSWIDASDNLWLFGGSCFLGELNDLWKFDGTKWTWVSGSNTSSQPGVYGTKGVAAPGNVPGARKSSVSWIDASGNFWLFGGYGHAASDVGWLNDLWKFDGVKWTWVSGSNTYNQYGFYGTKGVAAPVNKPGAREGSVSWIDASGNLWLFGGFGYDASGLYGYLNDLWKFDGAKWTWISGSKATNQSGVYDTKGVADQNNVPGAREGSVSWIDASSNFWLFGGYNSNGYLNALNDLWKFDGVNWTWVSGSNATSQYGIYGTKGIADQNNVPGARYGSVSWIDASGNLWLFGGFGYDASGLYGDLNDLWKFDGAKWTWVSGSNAANQYDIYSTKGVAASGNAPGAHGYSVAWADSSGSLWLFGGYGYTASGLYGGLNDLWKFGISEKAADMNEDGIVNYLDLMTLIDQWESSDAIGALPADMAPQPAGDGVVNFRDFAVLASHWMQ
jgi:N-acetylneuraminic acid mutarotase